MLTAIYDGNCIICNKTKLWITRLDRHHQVKFLDLHEIDYLKENFPSMTYEDAMGMLHVIDEQQQVYAGFDAVCRLLRLFPLTKPLYILSCTPFLGRRIGVFIYGIVARNRYGINRVLGGGSKQSSQVCATEQCKLS